MGLDSIELVLNVENEFNLKISDEDAERIWTVGALIEYVAERLGVPTMRAAVCPTAISFYSIRRLLTTRFDVPRRSIRPRVRLAALVPPHRRGALRAELESSGVPVTGVFRWSRLDDLCVCCSIIGACGAVWALNLIPSVPGWIAVVAGFGVILLSLATWTIGGLIDGRRAIPRRLTMRDLAVDAASALIQSADEPRSAQLEAIRSRVHHLVGEQVGIDPMTITDSMWFTRDLGF